MGDRGGEAARLTIPRFFVSPTAIAAGRIGFGPEQAHQIRRVLRMRSGDQVIVCDGAGDDVLAVVRVDGNDIWAEPGQRRVGRPRPRRSVWLYPSALRGDRFSWLLQKATEMGVSGVVPLIYRHTQPADYAARHARHAAIVREAAEQCERSTLPELGLPATFPDALSHCDVKHEICLLLDEQEHERFLRAAVSLAGDSVRLFVGPEGGLADQERDLAISHGLTPVSLGAPILRSETAALAGLALALGASGDLG